MSLITLELGKEEKILAKKTGLTHRMIYLRGLNNFYKEQKAPELQKDEMKALEKKIERLSSLLNHYVNKTNDLEEELKRVKHYGMV